MPLSVDERALLRGYVQRRGAGEPLQYITGEVGFRFLSLRVRKGVLIPRPETEVLVSEVLAALPRKRKGSEFAQDSVCALADAAEVKDDAALAPVEELAAGAKAAGTSEEALAAPEPLLVADLCTGSGCIACSLAYENPSVRVYATDIAPEAVALARENALQVGVSERVTVLEGDLGTCIPAELLGSFAAVVSNPPYVPTQVLAELPAEVADFEPRLALDGGTDGLHFFRCIASWSRQALKEGGLLACELHESCLDAAAEIARSAGFAQVSIVNDLADRPRVILCR